MIGRHTVTSCIYRVDNSGSGVGGTARERPHRLVQGSHRIVGQDQGFHMASQPKPTARARTNHPILPIVM